MTLKQDRTYSHLKPSFGTILNNMTLKHSSGEARKWQSFGTILNNMTLKPRRIIFFQSSVLASLIHS